MASAPNPTSTPDSLVLKLETSVVVPHFSQYYEGSIYSFYPNYSPMADGSLVTDVYLRHLRASHFALLVHATLFLVFLRNIFVAVKYVHCGKIKQKGLFKVLLASQLPAAPLFLVILVDFFNSSASCLLLAQSAIILNAISMGMLLTGILAVKAYRCLENSKWVIAVCVALRVASTVVAGIQTPRVLVLRRLTGGCAVKVEQHLFFVYLILQLLETLFLCICFFFTVWKTRRNPTARGRISLTMQSDDGASFVRSTHTADASRPRGWWDYTPKPELSTYQAPLSPQMKSDGPVSCVPSSFRTRLRSLGVTKKKDHSKGIKTLRRLPPFNFLMPSGHHHHSPRSNPDRASLPASTFSRLVPRMILFKRVMKDELLYTAVMASGCLSFLILVVLSTQLSLGLQSYHWLFLYWAFVSVLSVHSFGRVVKRHERDALLQHPSAWENSPRTDGFSPRRRYSAPDTRSIYPSALEFREDSDVQSLLQPPSRARSWQTFSSTSLSLSPCSVSLDMTTGLENYSLMHSPPPYPSPPFISSPARTSYFRSRPSSQLDRASVVHMPGG